MSGGWYSARSLQARWSSVSNGLPERGKQLRNYSRNPAGSEKEMVMLLAARLASLFDI
jgi:hypothetical protein